ncbi:MAG: mannonate dehydratase [Tannerellaceae bacterium]|nr:mannonate dehydratase [Tannerellaceae bacterium]
MNRRNFINASILAGGGMIASGAGPAFAARRQETRPPAGGKAEMQLAFDFFYGGPTNATKVQMAKELGVEYAVGGIMPARQLGLPQGTDSWGEEAVKGTVAAYRERGLNFCVVEGPPALGSQTKLALEGRDQEISRFITFLHAAGRHGVKVVCYNWMPEVGWFRTSSDRKTRGGSLVTAFDIESVDASAGNRFGREFTADEMWANLEYFMKAIVPEAEKAGVLLALHPDDPPIPSLRGIARILISADNMERAVNLYRNPVNGVTLCQGCFATMGEDVPAVIRRFAGRTFFVHFRDVRGTRTNFEEVYHDDGITDMYRSMKAYYETGFRGPIRPDHVPTMTGEDNTNPSYGLLGNLFAVGYMRGLMEAADKEVNG